MSSPEFPGAAKIGTSFLSPFERRLGQWLIPRLPGWLETYHLTLMTVVWCALIVVAGLLAADDIRWLWLSSAAVCGQYLTDHLDGKLGKYRDTGLVRWGYVVDHFLDYFFLCAILTAYAFLLPDTERFRMFYVLIVFGGYMVLAYLGTVATGSLRIAAAGFGPTEFRLAVIVINTLLIAYGPGKLGEALPWVTGGGSIVLLIAAYRLHRRAWAADMQEKHARRTAQGG